MDFCYQLQTMNQVYENIKKFRELKNMTRESVAAELDMSTSGYSKLERGEVELTVARLYKLAQILEVPPSEILNFDATRVFNVQNNQTINGVEVENQHIHGDDYSVKYISLLEKEVERLRQEVSRLSGIV